MRNSHTRAYHPTDEEIASFIEGSVGEIDGARIRVHLECCDRCLEAYHYAVRYRVVHKDMPVEDAPTVQALRAAKAIVERDYRRKNFDRRGRRRWVGNLSPAGRAILSASVVVVFVLAVVWLRPISVGSGFDPYSDSLAPITRVMVTASQRNPLVMPGVENALGPAPATLRSGPVPITPQLDNSLSRLALAYNSGSLTSDEVQWLVGGYLATGQNENARIFVADARRRYPKDVDLVVLEGLVAYSGDDLERAAGLFEEVLGEDAGHAVAAFNLAVVKRETGREAESREWFERVQNVAPGSPLAERAIAALSSVR